MYAGIGPLILIYLMKVRSFMELLLNFRQIIFKDFSMEVFNFLKIEILTKIMLPSLMR
jgi:hypothetical protein